ncbi:hypothetical protein R3P38DRAFT_1741823 [Favolaschia claudopus]|uniref:Uncharacterized protein n=1 Tax=Favolaschia claudopus TaxID=2862362 RepID=A0AAW0DHI6_9AGAR
MSDPPSCRLPRGMEHLMNPTDVTPSLENWVASLRAEQPRKRAVMSIDQLLNPMATEDAISAEQAQDESSTKKPVPLASASSTSPERPTRRALSAITNPSQLPESAWLSKPLDSIVPRQNPYKPYLRDDPEVKSDADERIDRHLERILSNLPPISFYRACAKSPAYHVYWNRSLEARRKTPPLMDVHEVKAGRPTSTPAVGAGVWYPSGEAHEWDVLDDGDEGIGAGAKENENHNVASSNGMPCRCLIETTTLVEAEGSGFRRADQIEYCMHLKDSSVEALARGQCL